MLCWSLRHCAAHLIFGLLVNILRDILLTEKLLVCWAFKTPLLALNFAFYLICECFNDEILLFGWSYVLKLVFLWIAAAEMRWWRLLDLSTSNFFLLHWLHQISSTIINISGDFLKLFRRSATIRDKLAPNTSMLVSSGFFTLFSLSTHFLFCQ